MQERHKYGIVYIYPQQTPDLTKQSLFTRTVVSWLLGDEASSTLGWWYVCWHGMHRAEDFKTGWPIYQEMRLGCTNVAR